MSVVRLREVCPLALCPSREKFVLKDFNKHSVNFLQQSYNDFKSVLRTYIGGFIRPNGNGLLFEYFSDAISTSFL